jgi:hypothetical protein
LATTSLASSILIDGLLEGERAESNIDRRQLQEATDQIDASETKFPTVAITTLSVEDVVGWRGTGAKRMCQKQAKKDVCKDTCKEIKLTRDR